MTRWTPIILLALAVAGCVATAPPRRNCPPLPELRTGATPAEHLEHTTTIVNMYVTCAKETQQ